MRGLRRTINRLSDYPVGLIAVTASRRQLRPTTLMRNTVRLIGRGLRRYRRKTAGVAAGLLDRRSPTSTALGSFGSGANCWSNGRRPYFADGELLYRYRVRFNAVLMLYKVCICISIHLVTYTVLFFLFFLFSFSILYIKRDYSVFLMLLDFPGDFIVSVLSSCVLYCAMCIINKVVERMKLMQLSTNDEMGVSQSTDCYDLDCIMLFVS